MSQTVQFPTSAPIAHIVVTTPSAQQQKESQLLARGKVTLPKDCQLYIELCYDGPTHIETLEQIDCDQVTKFSAAKLEFEDSHLTHLRKFKNLIALNLDSTLVTEKSWPVIGSFPKLWMLRVNSTDITGSGFGCLSNSHSLSKLDVEGILLKPGSIAKLKTLAGNLTALNVSKTGLTTVDMPAIGELHLLRRLDLSGNKKVADNQAKYLQPLVCLEVLNISDTAITEKSLPVLDRLPHLKKVLIRNGQFWTSGHPQKSKSGATFVDVGSTNRAPIEVFSPLH